MLLGRFEEAILMALIHINGQATIGDLSQALAEHKMWRSFGMLYTALDRMRDCRKWRANAVLRSRDHVAAYVKTLQLRVGKWD